jgi:hypothetical protein
MAIWLLIRISFDIEIDNVTVIRILAGLFFIYFLTSLAVSVRRLHDTGRSGWLLLLFFIPFVGIIFCIAYLIIMCMNSEPGTNEYGPSPKYSEINAVMSGNVGFTSFGIKAQPQPFMGEVNFGFCKNCGTKFPNGSPFCSNCGVHR